VRERAVELRQDGRGVAGLEPGQRPIDPLRCEPRVLTGEASHPGENRAHLRRGQRQAREESPHVLLVISRLQKEIAERIGRGRLPKATKEAALELDQEQRKRLRQHRDPGMVAQQLLEQGGPGPLHPGDEERLHRRR
jgi:hypothetical protein